MRDEKKKEICVVMGMLERVLLSSDSPVQALPWLRHTFVLEILLSIDILLRLRRIHLHPQVRRVWERILIRPTHGL